MWVVLVWICCLVWCVFVSCVAGWIVFVAYYTWFVAVFGFVGCWCLL